MSTRLSDRELDTYHGGRAAYIASIETKISELTVEIESGKISQAGTFPAVFGGARSIEDAQRELAQYRSALDLNQ